MLCTPTMTCKGFLTADSLCIVDLDGNLIEGIEQPTSEIKLHLNIYRPATGYSQCFSFASTSRHCVRDHGSGDPTTRLGRARNLSRKRSCRTVFDTGLGRFAQSIDPFIQSANAILLANHGVVTCHQSVETAFWLTEMLDSYCHILINAKAIGPVQTLTDSHAAKLAALRKRWGYEA